MAQVEAAGGAHAAEDSFRFSQDSIDLLGSVPQKVAGYYQALHFAGAFVNCQDAGVAVVALDVGFTRVAAAAVDLDGVVGYAIGHFAGVEFGARGSCATGARLRI